MTEEVIKPLRWVGSSLSDLRDIPEEVRTDIGFALWLAQRGEHPPQAKPMKGIVSGAGILQIVQPYHGNTYRAVYTVNFNDAVYVLHVFQKKSKRGIKTPKRDMDLIRRRFKWAEDDAREQ